MQADSSAITERMHTARDGVKLFVRSMDAAGAPAGVVFLVHGFGEHSARYLHVMRHFAAAGLASVAADLRGHGRSEGRRGDVADYRVFLDDLLEIWNGVAGANPAANPAANRLPVFLYGHSFGGQLALNFAATHRPVAAGMVVTSPLLQLAFAPPRRKLALAWVAARLWPSFTQETGIVPERLSRDQAFLGSMTDLDLVHHRMSARAYRFIMSGARRAEIYGAAVRLPILLMHGDCDPVTSPAATARLFENSRSPDKAFHLIPGALHEMHNDLCRGQIMELAAAWMLARCRP